ncbi:hypothetical protein [Sphingomonas sp.]|uniref:hypothetical protein n=1 Tax=Sphingomonas sp. TaxID=28214 RepID=UPI003B00C252
MDGPSAFFLLILALQAAFTAAVVVLVARRYPARAGAYRFVAPAAVPIVLMLFVAHAYVQAFAQAGMPLSYGPLARIALAYLVLWLVGMVWATLLVRLVRR